MKERIIKSNFEKIILVMRNKMSSLYVNSNYKFLFQFWNTIRSYRDSSLVILNKIMDSFYFSCFFESTLWWIIVRSSWNIFFNGQLCKICIQFQMIQRITILRVFVIGL